ncbi:CD63 antigen-like [Brachionichthys hirsutus]|uniref:CD63 antigen-like n=1 Tax=Brachionichthys hirsutus TaxID=412623 RepID=UPI0036050E28
MAKINGCLKCLFIFFNVLFAILGCLLIYAAVKSSAYSHQLSSFGGPSLAWTWVFAIGVLGISCLGIYAGCSEKELAIKIFAGFMGVGMIIMLIFGIIIVVNRNKLKTSFESTSSEVSKMIIEDEELRTMLDGLQQTSRCCGVVGASDWGDNIPESCTCDARQGYGGFGGFGSSGCKNKPSGASGPDRIYEQGCGEVIFMWVDIIFQIAMGSSSDLPSPL